MRFQRGAIPASPDFAPGTPLQGGFDVRFRWDPAAGAGVGGNDLFIATEGPGNPVAVDTLIGGSGTDTATNRDATDLLSEIEVY